MQGSEIDLEALAAKTAELVFKLLMAEQKRSRQGLMPAEATKREADRMISRLTPKQEWALQHKALGLSETQVAERMGISRNTVKLHASGIYRKFGCRSWDDAVPKFKMYRDALSEAEYRRASPAGLSKDAALMWTPDAPMNQRLKPTPNSERGENKRRAHNTKQT